MSETTITHRDGGNICTRVFQRDDGRTVIETRSVQGTPVSTVMLPTGHRIPVALALIGPPTPEMIERAEKAYVQALCQSDMVTGDDERLVRVVIDAFLNHPSPPLDTSDTSEE